MLIQEMTVQILNGYKSEREIFDTLKRSIIEELEIDEMREMIEKDMHITIDESTRELLELLKNGEFSV